MREPPQCTTTIAALDGATLKRALADETRPRLALALPAFRRAPDALREELATTGLLGARRALFVVTAAGGARFCCEAWCPDVPEVATTLRVALAPLDAPHEDPALEAAALGRLVDHLARTTTAVRFERLVPADDRRASAVCLEAGLRLEGVRARAVLVDGRPADAAVMVAFADDPNLGGTP